MRSRTGIALSLVLLGAAAGPTRAEMISFSFQGTSSSPGRDPLPLSGTITYDTQASPISAFTSVSGFSTPGSITITAGSSTVSTESFGPGKLSVSLWSYQMALIYQSWVGDSVPPLPQPRLLILLRIDSPLRTDSPYPSPVPLVPDLSSLPTRLPPGATGTVLFDSQLGDQRLLLGGELNNFAPLGVASVPEPGSLALAASGGLLGLAGVARRRRLAR
jgi:hypothetical protein